MLVRILANLGDLGLDALLKEILIDILLCIRIDGYLVPQCLELADAFQQIADVFDGPVFDWANNCLRVFVGLFRAE